MRCIVIAIFLCYYNQQRTHLRHWVTSYCEILNAVAQPIADNNEISLQATFHHLKIRKYISDKLVQFASKTTGWSQKVCLYSKVYSINVRLEAK